MTDGETVFWLNIEHEPQRWTERFLRSLGKRARQAMPSSSRVPIDEIEVVGDSELRQALYAQAAARRDDSRFVPIPFAFYPDGKFSHIVRVPKRPLRLIYDHPTE